MEMFRQAAETVLRAPFTRRNIRELQYCLLGALTGVGGIAVVLSVLASGAVLTLSIPLTAVGLLLIVVALRTAKRFGSVHRRLLARYTGAYVQAPPPFQPGKGILGRLDKRLRDKTGWRAVTYVVVAKFVLVYAQGYTVVLAVSALINMSYPVLWAAFRRGPGTTYVALVPLPFGGSFNIHNWFETIPGALAGIVAFIIAAWLARGFNAIDRRLIRSLLGPQSLTERVSELERTRALAVEDSVAVLRRVERDLHDGAQMRLAALAMNLGMAREKLDGEADPDTTTARELIEAAQRNAVDALAELRDLAKGIHPPVLDNGLADALATLATSSAIPATVDANLPDRPAPAIETIAYFCVAELLANATKHSYANQIKIYIYAPRPGVLHLIVADDGVGGAGLGKGSGLTGLTERVSTVDGKLHVSSPSGGPTVVTVELPMRA